MKWKIKSLENAVRNIHGNSIGDKIRNPLQSFHKRSVMAYYHADESKDLIDNMLRSTEKINENYTESMAMAKAIILAASPGGKGHHILEAQFKAEAHVIASAQAMHSLCDILSVIVYWTLRLDTYSASPQENKINLHSINKVLRNTPKYFLTYKSIKNTISSPEFEYLAAFVNTIKHQSLIPSKLSASFEADQKNGLRINDFTYKDYRGQIRKFDRKWSTDFLFTENQKLRINLLKIGNTLNYYTR